MCEIWVNGKFLTKHMNPYTGVIAEATALVHPGENVIQVHVDSRLKPNSRWYVGTGLYRRVWLHLAEPVSVSPEGLHVTTKVLDGDQAVLHLSAQLTGRADNVTFTLKAPDGGVISEVPAVLSCEAAQADMNVSGIIPWCPDRPALYTVEARVETSGAMDAAAARTGIRTVSVDAKNGFRLNGQSMKLRGGCIHHDLGILGAAEYKAAELRRVRHPQPLRPRLLRGLRRAGNAGY